MASPPHATANIKVVMQTVTVKIVIRFRVGIVDHSTRLVSLVVRLSLQPGTVTIFMNTKNRN